jgi:CBS domain-containing protein
MEIRTCMKSTVYSISDRATVRQAAHTFVHRHIGLLPVVDGTGKPVGVVRLADLLMLELPDFVKLIQDVDFVHSFGAVETNRPTSSQLDQPITRLMQPVHTVLETSGLLRAYSLMLQYDLHDVPVVSQDGALVGIASRVDIGTAILSSWESVMPDVA